MLPEEIQGFASSRGNALSNSRRIFCWPHLALIFLLIFVCASISALGAQQRTATKPATASASSSGKKIFASACAPCHGLDARGGEHAPNIATRAEVQRLSDAEIFRVVRDGSPSKAMPAFGRALDSAKITAVTKYLRVLQGSHTSLPLPGDAEAGKKLFYGKAGCSACHMVSGAGGFIGVDLSSYALTHSADQLHTAITNPNENPKPSDRAVVVTTQDGKTITGVARNEDNFSLQLQSLDGTFHLLLKSDAEKIEYQPRSLMPADYGSKLSARELNDLISFLIRSSRDGEKAAVAAGAAKREDQ